MHKTIIGPQSKNSTVVIGPQPTKITQKFKAFMHDNLRYRCQVTKSVYDKYFDTPESWSLLHTAFIHKSMEKDSYELIEFHGDVVLNLAVVEAIREDFPTITSIDWNSGLKINFVSGHFLAKTAVKYGFWEYIAFSEKLLTLFNNSPDPKKDEKFLKANEDVFEAVCGAITQILNKHLSRGIGYHACYNFVKTYLDESDEVILFKTLVEEKQFEALYNRLKDAKSRLKEVFDMKGWDKKGKCTLATNLKMYNISEETIDAYKPMRDVAMRIYKDDMKKIGKKPEWSILNSTDRFLNLGYICNEFGSIEDRPFNENGTINKNFSKKIFVAKTSADAKTGQQYVATELIAGFKRMGIYKPHTSPFKTF